MILWFSPIICVPSQQTCNLFLGKHCFEGLIFDLGEVMSFDRCQFNPIKPDTLNNNQIFFFLPLDKKNKNLCADADFVWHSDACNVNIWDLYHSIADTYIKLYKYQLSLNISNNMPWQNSNAQNI